MNRQNDRGFTLMEVMIALALSVMTIGAIYSIYRDQVQSQLVRDDTLNMQQHVRAALDLIVLELKMAGYDPRHVNQDDIPSNDFEGIAYDPTRLMMKADLNGNGRIAEANESVLFSYDSSAKMIRRDTGGGKQPLAEHIENFSISYVDENGQLTTESKEVRQLELTIKGRTARPDPKYPNNEGYRTVTLRSRITPRNLGS